MNESAARIRVTVDRQHGGGTWACEACKEFCWSWRIDEAVRQADNHARGRLHRILAAA